MPTIIIIVLDTLYEQFNETLYLPSKQGGCYLSILMGKHISKVMLTKSTQGRPYCKPYGGLHWDGNWTVRNV